MRILVGTGLNQGAAEYQNIGDIAMLQVAVGRLAELWPEAEILVLTDSEAGLNRFCPRAKPVSRCGAETWLLDGVITGPLHLWLPQWMTKHIRRTKRWLRTNTPGLINYLLRCRFRLHDGEARGPKVESFMKAIRNCNLLVIAGCGGFADSCSDWNLYALGLIEAALGRGKPVALFGQGLGPLADIATLVRMAKLLPRVCVFASRGTAGAERIAEKIGIPKSAFYTTGDDAVEPAYRASVTLLGSAIGVNVRIAPYSGISDDQGDRIGLALRAFAQTRGADLIPLPVAMHSFADDRKSIARLLSPSATSIQVVESPEDLFAQISKCRVVVTGAYHAAVFALAQGIPTVCICGSDYYAAKFEGLQALFGKGCTLLYLHKQDSLSSLSDTLDKHWETAEAVKIDLQNQALVQINASKGAYRALRELFPVIKGASSVDSAVLSIP